MSDTKQRTDLGARLKEAREYLGFSQDEVSKFLGLPRSAISLIETGARKLDVLELGKLAQLYQCTVEDLTGKGARQDAKPESVDIVARAAAKLSEQDRSEVLRFVEFLQSRGAEKQK